MFLLIAMNDTQRVLQMQQLERVLGTEAGGAQPDWPQHARHHLHLRAQPPMADPAQRARRLNPVSSRQERRLGVQELAQRKAATAKQCQGREKGSSDRDD
jgi:hypothetical protein